ADFGEARSRDASAAVGRVLASAEGAAAAGEALLSTGGGPLAAGGDLPVAIDAAGRARIHAPGGGGVVEYALALHCREGRARRGRASGGARAAVARVGREVALAAVGRDVPGDVQVAVAVSQVGAAGPRALPAHASGGRPR